VNLKVLGAVGAGVLMVVVVGVALWQANKLVATGQELAQLKNDKRELKRQLTDKVEEVNGLIDSYETKVQQCLDQVSTAVTAGEIWRSRVAELEEELEGATAVVERPVEITTADCAEGLVEGRAIVRARLEEVRHALSQ
jgi:chromosome segregation ATPase